MNWFRRLFKFTPLSPLYIVEIWRRDNSVLSACKSVYVNEGDEISYRCVRLAIRADSLEEAVAKASERYTEIVRICSESNSEAAK